MHEMKKYALIVAGGKGLRMGTSLPKQFLPLAGKPMLYYSIHAFLQAVDDISIILVLPEDMLSYAQIVLQAFPERIDLTIVAGGPTRFHSVQNGLATIEGDGLVAVHDGARPMVKPEMILRCFQQAAKNGSAIPVIPVTDSVRIVEGGNSRVVPRDQLRIIQTPQVFQSAIIKNAFEQEYCDAFTDEATVLEANGGKVTLVDGDKLNIKVTTPEDMLMAEYLLNAR